MQCYRDKSFCTQNDCIKRAECPNYFSEKHEKRAKELGLQASLYKETICYKKERTQ